MKNQSKPTPMVFMIIAVVAILWNLAGVGAYLSDMFITSEQIAKLKPGLQELYKNTPMVQKILYGFGVFGGLLGSICLLRKKSFACTFFLISLIAVVLQFFGSIFFTDAIELLGYQSLILPSLVILIAAFLFFYASFLRKKAVLT